MARERLRPSWSTSTPTTSSSSSSDRYEESAGRSTASSVILCPTQKRHKKDTHDTTKTISDAIDILVNNAGISHSGSVEEADLVALRRTIRVKLEGVVNVTHAALPAILESGCGDIITVSSLSARFEKRCRTNRFG
ncbi:SDR family oxidoreductase [Natronosalvus vescus]|uniref:SDR family oxidoreductase n=1 Tax=Natronosalvus vescus TaxID=2953881 RepID=UPI003A390F39